MKKLISFALCIAMLTMAVSAFAADADTLTMATNASFPPYEFREGEDVVGIDADIAAAVCEKLGYKLKIDDMEFDSIIAAVQSGKADFAMAGMTVTEERAQMVDFSDSYATGIQAVVVKEGSPITTVDDLFVEGANYSVGVQLSTTGDIYVTGDIEEAGLGKVMRYPNGNEAVMALKNGKIDCVVIDNEPAKAYVAANEGLKVLDTQYAVEDYAACFAKDSELVAKFNEALKGLIEDGTVKAIVDKYISAE
ncbi:transporter substrate-binding domain-containing protein [Beduinella massiliensis]|uniref:transporter substrate-binding domain-containing protein n=1 Tax=Beduinella massiliensis TaxID=1852363 RepID=UPI000C84A66A